MRSAPVMVESVVDVSNATRFQCDLYRYWRATRRAGALALGARGYLALAAFRRVAARLRVAGNGSAADDLIGEDVGEPSQPRLLFIRRLLERLDLLEKRGDQRLYAAAPAAMAAYLELPLVERVRRCAQVWVAGGWWPDMPDTRRPLLAVRVPAPPRIALARRHLLHDLLALELGESLPIPLAPATVAVHHTGQRGARAAAVEGATERAALLGPLRWLGLIAVDDAATAASATPALDALRASGAGVALDESHGRITIQANFEIVAFPPHTAPALFVLDHCAEARGTERVARYALTRRAFAAARRLGWAAGAVAARLAALADGTLPLNVAVTLADWDRQADRLSLQAPVTLVEVGDPALLDALLRERQAAAWVARRLTPEAALIHERHCHDVRAWLLRHGELPAMVDHTAADDSGETP